MTKKHAVLFLRKAGANHMFGGRRAEHLRKELLAGRGGPEIARLVENGYVGYLGPDGEVWEFEALLPEHFN